MPLKSTENLLVFTLASFLLAVLVVGWMTPAFGQGGSVVGSPHDLSGGGGDACQYCHTPHISPRGATLLWAPLFSQTNFGVYDSPTLDSKAQPIGGAYDETNPPTGPKLYSVLCMSCHDGIMAWLAGGVLPPGSCTGCHDSPDPERIQNIMIGHPDNSAGLTNDHPVNMDYNSTLDTGLASASGGTVGSLPLYGNTVQCASCHDPHNNSNTRFLRLSNAGSAMCFTCHLK